MSNKKREAEAVTAYVNLLVAEVNFLTANGWHPCSPAVPGGEVQWRNPYEGWSAIPQDQAVEVQKRQERK